MDRSLKKVSINSSTGVEIPDYLGIQLIFHEFRQGPFERIEKARNRLKLLYDNYVVLSEFEDIGVLNRISVVMHSAGS